MFKALLRVRLIALYKSMFSRMGRGNAKRGPGMRILIGLLAVYVVAMLLFSFGTTFYTLCEPLTAAGLDWLYFALTVLFSVALGFVGSIFITQKQLFESTDNELLLSLPIRPSLILSSRLTVLVLYETVVSLLLLVPAGVVYQLVRGFTLPGLLCFAVICLLLPFLTLTLSSLCAWISALISARMRRKNLIATLLMLVFFGGYFYLYTTLQKSIEKLITDGTAIAEAVKNAFPPAWYVGQACLSDGKALALTAACCLVPFGLCCLLLSVSFIRITTARRGAARVKYVRRELRASGVGAALLRKELTRIFSLPTYLVNDGLGALLQLILAGALLIKGRGLTETLGMPAEMAGLLPLVSCAIICFCAMMTCFSSASISLEGRSFWLLRSCPVGAKPVLAAKTGATLVIGMPAALIASVTVCAVFRPNLTECLGILLLPQLVQLFTAFFGLWANLKFPRFDWINEVLVVKQSGAAMLAVLGGMGLLLLPCVGYALLAAAIPSGLYLLLACGYYALLAALCGGWLFAPKGGVARLESL